MFVFLLILVVFVMAWGVMQYSLLFPQAPPSFLHPLDAFSMAFFQMFIETNTDGVIRSTPYHMPEANDTDWCTDEPAEYTSYDKLRLPSQ